MSLTIHHVFRLFTGQNQQIKDAVLIVEDDTVIDVAHIDDLYVQPYLQRKDAVHVHHGSTIMVPGFIDIHNHGALGHDFTFPDQENMDRLANYFATEGTTSFLASTMARPRKDELAYLSVLGKLQIPAQGARWVGIHDEGPYLNMKYRAVMEAEGIRPFIKGEIDEDVRVSNSRMKMITVAPETEDIETLIIECHRHQIAVMFAHTNATAQQTLHALEVGGDGFTHLYNAMTPHTHRNPGAVTAALLKGNSYCELVLDGFHVDPLVVKLTHQIIGSKRLIAITDSNPGKGLGNGEFIFGGVVCESKDGKATIKETGRIAGSTIGMIDAFRNIIAFTGCDIEDAVEMCTVNPARLLKLDKIGSLTAGYKADFVILNEAYEIISTYRDGQKVYESKQP